MTFDDGEPMTCERCGGYGFEPDPDNDDDEIECYACEGTGRKAPDAST